MWPPKDSRCEPSSLCIRMTVGSPWEGPRKVHMEVLGSHEGKVTKLTKATRVTRVTPLIQEVPGGP